MKIGDSYGIIFNKEEVKNFNLNLGDIIEFDDNSLKEKVKNGRK